MKRTFREFMDELEADAAQEGPQAVAEFEAFKAYFRAARDAAVEVSPEEFQRIKEQCLTASEPSPALLRILASRKEEE